MMGSRAKYSSVKTKVGKRMKDKMRGRRRILGPAREISRVVMAAVCEVVSRRDGLCCGSTRSLTSVMAPT